MNKLLLLSGQDLPFVGGQTNIHQPRLKQIAMLSENIFYLGANFLCFSKDNLQEKDKNNLVNQTNFDILMSIINSQSPLVQQSVIAAKILLSLIFPEYQLKVLPNLLLLTKIQQDGTKNQCIINNDNYEEFKQIVQQMFCLKAHKGGDYNPANKKAEQIANKLRKRREIIQKKNGQTSGQINILYHYVLKLTLGNHHTIPELMEYTVYQIFYEFNTFEKKYNYDIWLKAKIAGAENLDDVQNWLSLEDNQSPTQTLPKSNRIEF